MSIPAQAPVKIVTNDSQARLILDPMRLEILRMLSRRTHTAKDLSEIIGLTPPSIGHHLKALCRGELVSITHEEPGSHGIMQKWYRANAQAFVVDKEHLPKKVQRYFMPVDLERARAVAACVSLMKGTLTPSTKFLEDLARQICRSICREAQRFPSEWGSDPEWVVHRLYVEALRRIIG